MFIKRFAFFAVLIAPRVLFAQTAIPAPGDDEREWRVGEEMRRQTITRQEESGVSPDQALENWREQQRHATGENTLGVVQHFNWEYLGPANQSGRVTELLPLNGGSQLVAGAAGGGIWKYSYDAAWHVKTDSFPGLQMTACAAEPQNPAMMVMGTSQGYLYVSSDSGNSWRVATKSPGSNIMSLAFHPTNLGMLYAACDAGLAVTTDFGNTWKTVAPGRARSVIIDPKFPELIYYGQMDYGWPNSRETIMKSVDGGKTFNAVFTQPQGYWSDVLFGMCRSSTNVLWVGTDSARVYFRSTDAGASWQQCAGRPYSDSYYNGFWCFFADPTNPNNAIAGGPALFRTTDAGATWVRIDSLVHADFHSFIFPGGTKAALGCDGGVYVTDNYLAPSVVWRYQSTGLKTLQAYNVAGSPDGSDIVITGNQDNGYAKYTADPLTWRIVGGDGFVTIYNPKDPTIFYHEYVSMNLHRANDGFTWWSTKIMTGLPTTTDFYTGIVNEPVDWYGQAVAIDPSNPNVLYCGTDSLFVTSDNGDSWNLQSQQAFTRGSFVSAIAVSPADSNTIYVGSNDGLLSFTHDHGATWDTVAQSQLLRQSGRIYSIDCDPTLANTAYISMQVSGTPLFRTTDGGFTWTGMSKGLPSTSTSKILVDPKNPSTLYVATATGVGVSNDRGNTWQTLAGLPNVQVIDLSWQFLSPGAQQCLLVATYGRGIIRGRIGAIYSSDTAVHFPRTRVGKSSDTTVKTFVSNNGTNTLSVLGLKITGADSSAFKITSNSGGFSLPSNSNNAVSIRFSPQAERAYNATVNLVFSDGTSSAISQLTGTGTIPHMQTIPRINFGSLAIGSAMDSVVALTVTNFADAPDTLVVQPRILGSNAAAFSLPMQSGVLNLTASGANTLTVQASPITSGAMTASLILSTNGLPSLDTIQLLVNATAEVGEGPVPSDQILLECQPNPATSAAKILVRVGERFIGKRYNLTMVDDAGRVMAVLASQESLSTTIQKLLPTGSIANGTYFIRFETLDKNVVQRIVLNH